MNRRGHVLYLLLVFLAACVALSATFFHRVEARAAARRPDQTRLQLLWLARSAAARGQVGTFPVRMPSGMAQVTTKREATGLVATATLSVAEATVRRGDGAAAERYTTR